MHEHRAHLGSGAHLGVETPRSEKALAAADGSVRHMLTLGPERQRRSGGVRRPPRLSAQPHAVGVASRGTKAALSTYRRAELALPRLAIRLGPAELGGVGRAERDAPPLLGRVA